MTRPEDREQFEAEAKAKRMSLRPKKGTEGRTYFYDATEAAWCIWKAARAALPATVALPPPMWAGTLNGPMQFYKRDDVIAIVLADRAAIEAASRGTGEQ